MLKFQCLHLALPVSQEGRTALHLVCERGDNNSLQFIILSDSETLINVQDQVNCSVCVGRERGGEWVGG